MMECAHEQRAAWLKIACDEDAELRAEVENLMANHRDSEKFLSPPALDDAAAQVAQNQELSLLGQKISHYRILSLLGAGGMGEVYLAEDTNLRRKIALKVLPVGVAQDKDRLYRFKQEAFAASALNHPNILTIFEFGAEGEAYFLASELVEGETLRVRMRRSAISISETLGITIQIASALQAAHAANIIHRDIKPENVMIRNDGIVKVLDFGLAKLVAPPPSDSDEEAPTRALTQAGTILGTVQYMSPEQARGMAVDARADLFSLGVVLYEMLTGRRPFTGETISHTIVAILEKEPPPLTRTGRHFPVEIEQIIKQALGKKPEERYQSAPALLADLRKLKHRLEFEAEHEITSIKPPASEKQSRAHRVNTSESIADERAPEAAAPLESVNIAHVLFSDEVGNPAVPSKFQAERQQENNGAGTTNPLEVPFHPERAANDAAQTHAPAHARRKLIWLVCGFLAAGVVSLLVWQVLRPRSVNQPAQVAAALPERNLSYFLTVQKYRDGKPYQTEFQSSGREIFEPGWRFKLNVTSPQEGFLYVLNEASAPAGSQFTLLFPMSSHNQGSAHLVANERLQTNWYFFDDMPGTEQFRLIWAAQPVPELEAVRGLVNPTDQGRISNPAQIQAVRALLRQHAQSPVASAKDTQNKQTYVRGQGAVLVVLVELEHH